MALDIFAGMKNETKTSSNNDTDIADINASVDILDIMAKASKTTPLKENIFPVSSATFIVIYEHFCSA